MIDHSPRPGKIQPGTLFLRTAGACELDPEHLLEVFGEQRQRFVTVLRGFGPDDWAAPTRCAGWSAHDVVRHLCDANAIGIAAGRMTATRRDGRASRLSRDSHDQLLAGLFGGGTDPVPGAGRSRPRSSTSGTNSSR